MTQLTREDVRHIAYLARIGLSDAEVARYQKNLSAVLAHFGELAAVPTDDVQPIGHITGMTNVLRSDRAVPCDDATKKRIMDAVPATSDEGYIVVKSVGI